MPRKKKDSFILPIFLVAIFLAILSYALFSATKVPTDRETGCALETDYSSSVLSILLDSTQPTSAIQLKLVTNKIFAEVEETGTIRPGDRLRLLD